MSLTAQITSAFAGSLIVLAHEMPVIVFLMGHLRRLSAPLKPGQQHSSSTFWLVLLFVWAAAALLAGMGITLAVITYATDYTDYTAGHICAMLVPALGLFVTWLARPDSDLSWWEFVGSVPQLGLSVATLTLLWLGTISGAYANYLPMGLYFTLPVVHLVYFAMRLLEQLHVVKTRFLDKKNQKTSSINATIGGDTEPLMMMMVNT